MRKSVHRFYVHKRDYDFCDYDTCKGRRVTKKRAHKRLRRQLTHKDSI